MGKITQYELELDGNNEFAVNISGDANSVNNHTAAATPHTTEQVDLVGMINEVNDQISNTNVVTPAIAFGMNNKITNSSKQTVSPSFTITGNTIINILGKDGNCEDTSKWSVSNSTLALDSSAGNRMFGTNAIKVTSSASGNSYCWKAGFLATLQTNSYYCLSAYIKNGNCPGVIKITPSSGVNITNGASTSATDSTKFTRVMFLISTGASGLGGDLDIYTTATAAGQYFWVDGVMVEQITAAQYAMGASFVPSPYVDSYACLQNPYIEVRHDNLVRNGNGEEGTDWWQPQYNSSNSNLAIFQYTNGYFYVSDTDTDTNDGYSQIIPVKPNTTYSASIHVKCGTAAHARLAMVMQSYSNADGYLDTSTRVDTYTTSTTDTVLTATINTGNYTALRFCMLTGADANGYLDTGTAYFAKAMLVEGSTPPSVYLSCTMERTVLETKLTADDTITLAGNSVSGTINWRHDTMYGRDWDWQYDSAGTGWKTVALHSEAYLNSLKNITSVKYDGSILKPWQATIATGDFLWTSGDGNTVYLTINNSDSGWADNVYPTNDCVRAFMNGWKAIVANSGTSPYYFCWISAVDGSVPAGAVNTTTTGTSASGQPVLNVTYGSVFTAGDNITLYKNGAASTYTVSSVTSTTITCTTNLSATYDNTWVVIRDDFGQSSLPLLNYCKDNVAPGYDGYQIHAHLANPDEITDANCRLKGDMPLLNVGDNYVLLDTGMVLGEVFSPTYVSYANRYRANSSDSSYFKYKGAVNTVYKNGQFDLEWAFYTWGLIQTYAMTSTGIDWAATYSADYKIFNYIAPQAGTLTCSYTCDIADTVTMIQQALNNKQNADSALDVIVDSSEYEELFGYVIYGRGSKTNAGISLYGEVPLLPKKAVPTVNLQTYSVVIFDSNGNGYGPPNSDCNIDITPYNNHVRVKLFYVGTNTTYQNNLLNYGGYLSFNLIADATKTKNV